MKKNIWIWAAVCAASLLTGCGKKAEFCRISAIAFTEIMAQQK